MATQVVIRAVTCDRHGQNPWVSSKAPGLSKYAGFPTVSMALTVLQRKPSGDPYIELTEIETGSQTKKGFRADEDKQIERGTSQGILRTVEIDMTEESVKLPPHAVTTNHQADVSTEVTGNRTRLYDDDDV